jgi:hydrogenase expression/formation protein HypD
MRTEGCDVRTVYSIQDAVTIAEKNPNKEVVFMAVGFETTAPTTAVTLLRKPPKNFSILSCHRLIPPALRMIVEMGEIDLDGFIDPGHVSTIIGTKPYEFLSSEYHIPQVVAGFEPVDLVMAVWMLVNQNQEKAARVDNEYKRAVDETGNKKAQEAMDTVFDAIDVTWRGFPVIDSSGLELAVEFDEYNARKRFEDELTVIQQKEFPEPTGCRCGELLRGIISPSDCPLFGKTCTPDHPVGPCMVSVEGSCNITFKYGVKYNKRGEG